MYGGVSLILLFIVLALCVYRVTHLITTDHFPPVAKLRDRVWRKFGDDSWVTYLSTCQWCVSVYVGGVLTLLTDLIIGIPSPWLWWGAASAVTGFLSAVEPE